MRANGGYEIRQRSYQQTGNSIGKGDSPDLSGSDDVTGYRIDCGHRRTLRGQREHNCPDIRDDHLTRAKNDEGDEDKDPEIDILE